MNPLPIHNPATGARIIELAADNAASVAAKAVQARVAQPTWAALPLRERKACISR
ncbi:MAG: aldehyde dehydrogenase family protein, partial [Polaromonas sp.]